MLNHKMYWFQICFLSLAKFGNICLTGRISDFRLAIKFLHSVLIKQNYVRLSGHCCNGGQCWSSISIPIGIMVVIGQSISYNVSWWGVETPLDCTPEVRHTNSVTLTQLMTQKLNSQLHWKVLHFIGRLRGKLSLASYKRANLINKVK